MQASRFTWLATPSVSHRALAALLLLLVFADISLAGTCCGDCSDSPAAHEATAIEPAAATRTARPILVTGATGTLGQAFGRICAHRGLKHVLTTRTELDITNEASIAAALERYRPWAIINTAGFVRTWEADEKFEECLAINATGPELLGQACKAAGIPLVTFSSDLVFDGTLGRAYVESDEVCPTGVYGRSKATAEKLVKEAFPEALVVRTSAFFGPWDTYNFVHMTLRALKEGRRVEASDAAVFPAPRRNFLRAWIGTPGHVGRALVRDGELAGWGVIRPCRKGFKIGPLVAEDRTAAATVLAALLAETTVIRHWTQQHALVQQATAGPASQPGYLARN